MVTLGFWGWLLVIFVAMVVSLIVSLTNTAIVLIRSYASPSPRLDGVYVEIIGRQGGLLEWLFALLGIDATLEMRIRYDKVEYLSASLSGFTRVVIPIESISSVYFGVVRPWRKALIALITFLFGSYTAAELGSSGAAIGFTLAGVIVSFLIFVLGREKMIGLSEVNGENFAVSFKRSAIEGEEISEDELDKISKIMIALIDARKG